MQFVRRHLRKGTSVWLMCHALTFTALMPRDCCAAHAHAAGRVSAHGAHAAGAPAEEMPCHEAAAPVAGAHCEMTAEDGAACPMHSSGAAPADCRLTGTCHAPEAALAAVILQAGVAPAPLVLHVDPLVSTSRPSAEARPLALLVPPDAPPPRL